MVTRYVAFLRGMNLGKRRIRNEELCACFSSMGFENVSAFLASGNVIFESDERPADEIIDRIQVGLQDSLHYDVPTFLRSADELIETAGVANRSFTADLAKIIGKVQIAFLKKTPSATARQIALALQTKDDRLAIHGRELLWLPSGGISQSDLDFKLIESALGPMTVRTKRTVDRIIAKYFT